MEFISKMLGFEPKVVICSCQVDGPTVCRSKTFYQCSNTPGLYNFKEKLLLDCTTREECGYTSLFVCC